MDEGNTLAKVVLSILSAFLRKWSLQRRKKTGKRQNINILAAVFYFLPERKTKKNIDAYLFFRIFHLSDIAAQFQ